MPLLMMWLTVRAGLLDVARTNQDPPLTMTLGQYGQTDAYVSGPYRYQDVYKDLVNKQDGTAISVGDRGLVDGEDRCVSCISDTCLKGQEVRSLL
jgi:hypothetical protein